MKNDGGFSCHFAYVLFLAQMVPFLDFIKKLYVTFQKARYIVFEAIN